MNHPAALDRKGVTCEYATGGGSRRTDVVTALFEDFTASFGYPAADGPALRGMGPSAVPVVTHRRRSA